MGRKHCSRAVESLSVLRRYVKSGSSDSAAEHHKWFDSLLKGVDNGFDKRPPFVYYVMNAKEGEHWRFSDTWPVENEKRAVLYLSPEKSGTCGSKNDGSLSLVRPDEQTSAEYLVDTSIEVFDEGEGGTFDRMKLFWEGDMTKGVDEKGLTFTSLPLFPRYRNEMVGNVSVELWVTCSQNDADFLVYLEEVKKDGASRYVSMGMMRASHRTEAPRAAWEEAGAFYHPCMEADQAACLKEGMDQPVRLRFAVEPTAWQFEAGSRLRLTVTCANKKAFQHPMYREDDLPVIRLYQGGDHASFISVPFIEHQENVYNGTVRRSGYEGPGTLYFFEKKVYLYFNGTWEKYQADSRDMKYEMKNGEAVFQAGFTFRMEGKAKEDGIIQDYQGNDQVITPLPWKRRQVVDTVPVAVHDRLLFVPTMKTLYVEEYRMDTEGERPPAVLYVHGYNGTPSYLGEQQLALLHHGYAVIGIDMRNYPPNCFPDYVFDMKGCIRYVRANADRLSIRGDKIGCCGQSLGGNGTLIVGASAGDPELEGDVGGNLGVSSRLQAMSVGFGWSDMLSMGPDLLEEYQDYPEEWRKIKYENTDGPTAPLAEVIGFSGPGKGIGRLRKYLEEGGAGTDPYLDEMARRAYMASPINHIKPDFPPTALYAGLGMVRVDIPDRQSYRTFERCSRYGADCFLFGNTNGEYGRKFPVVQALLAFFDQFLKMELPHRKTVARPGSRRIVENFQDKELAYIPFVKRDGKIWIALEYLEEFTGNPLPEELREGTEQFEGHTYLLADRLNAGTAGYRYYSDKDMCVLLPASVMENNYMVARN